MPQQRGLLEQLEKKLHYHLLRTDRLTADFLSQQWKLEEVGILFKVLKTGKKKLT